MNYTLFACLLSLGVSVYAHIEDSPLFYGEYSGTIIIRWDFQHICDHVFDPRTENHPTNPDGGVTFDPQEVKKGDLIFVRDVDAFMNTLFPKIDQPFLMITAGVFLDQVLPDHERILREKNIIAWFSVHPCCPWFSEKFFPLPLGMLQGKHRYENIAAYNEYFAQLRQIPKKHLLYMNFRTIPFKEGEKYPDRDEVYELFKNEPYVYRAKRKSFKKFAKNMAECKFVVSPEGLGPDCYRTWEALLVGSIPIVKRTATEPLFEGLPVLIIDDWQEITQEFLEKKWEDYRAQRYHIEKLFMEYWLDTIYHVRDTYLQMHHT